MALIPFIFIWQGENIRLRSKFCQYLLQKEAEEEEKKQRRARRQREMLQQQEVTHVQAKGDLN